jgi:kynurenine formamidase
MCSREVIRQATPSTGVERGSGAAPGSAEIDPNAFTGKRRVQDLTHVTTAEFPVFPGDRSFEARRVRTLERHGYLLQELSLSEHTGTHLDAPAHFFAEGETAENLPLGQLIAPLVVISIADRVARDHDARLVPDDVLRWEERHGRIPEAAVVALHSGWEERHREPARYLNMDSAGVMHTPGFGGDAAEFLVRERSVAALATDTLSLDIGASTDYEAHVVLLGAGKYGLENVANLALVPPGGAMLVVGGPKHVGATGGPARLIAFH